MSTRYSLLIAAGVIAYVALNLFGLALLRAASSSPQDLEEVEDASGPHAGGDNSLYLVSR